MSNIKKARYTNALKPFDTKLSVIKVTGTSKNIKQINYFLPKEYDFKKIDKKLYALFLIKQVKSELKFCLKVNDWISVDEYDEVEVIIEEEFEEIITLVD